MVNVGVLAKREPQIYLGSYHDEPVQTGTRQGRAFCQLKSSQTGKTYAIALTCILFAANICGAYGANNEHNYQAKEWTPEQRMAVGIIVFILALGFMGMAEGQNRNRGMYD